MPSTTPSVGTNGFGNINLVNGQIAPPAPTPNPNFQLNSSNMLGMMGGLNGSASGGPSSFIPQYAPGVAGSVPQGALSSLTPTSYNTNAGTGAVALPPAPAAPKTPATPNTGSTPQMPPIAQGAVIFNGQQYFPGQQAPQGYSWNSQGTGFVPTNSLQVNVNPGTSYGSNAASEQPSTFADLLDSVTQNLQNYQQQASMNQDELNAQQQLLGAIQQQQNVNTNIMGIANRYYGTSAPLDLANANYNDVDNTGYNLTGTPVFSQIQKLQAQNAVNLAQQGLGLQQQNRQIREQVAGQQLNASLSQAGLAKPEAVYPGSSLVSPTGQVTYQGSGITAASPETISSIANMLAQNGTFPDYATALAAVTANPSAYIPGMSANTGGTSDPTAMSSLMNNGSTVPTVSGNNVFGYDLSSYATDPQYGSKVGEAVGTMPQAMTTPNQIQSWIDSEYKNSPITGQMIYNASSAYGVSPKVVAGIMAVETQMGTDGSAGAKMNNPGNWDNTDTAMANGQPVGFGSPQDGVNHVAQWVSQHFVGSGQQQTGMSAPPSAPNLPQSQVQLYNAVRSQLPPQVAPALDSLSDGSLFFDQSKVPSASQNFANSFSQQTGIPILTTDEVGAVRAADNAMSYLEQMRGVFDQLAGSGLMGRIQGLTLNQLGAFFQTSPLYKQFGAFRDTAIRLIQGLAGGSGSGLRINQSEIDTQTGILPNLTDNLESGNAAIDQVESFMQQKMTNLLPNYTPPAQGTSGAQSQQSQQPSQVIYQGQTYNVDAQGNMSPA